ncbi:hypothetical protein POSPLADRAFT_1130969 [Postia placenta MAD-698-R-SB12]|uniref:Uncharacterized protein n=1 Tax=Postia placenta MAD-698-R-SB12 TaxID=670580 RepID=A0A1X6NDM6_9APHY|nr:hypothetical protein POSPLADRAFT_1130969 [Postia placenta MAD-698-R-SB12]OSX66738.1 hypothetical protein POSPLADRAFT_1130969 [Postia placenta MAD-698-R-SB12]
MTQNTGAHLTTSRITRLFRPLRAKCTSLADLAASSSRKTHSVSITYSKHYRGLPRTASLETEAPPLAVLQPPENLGLRIHLDKASVENLQLSKKIYEVRDAFRSFVQAVLGTSATNEPAKPTRIMGLAAMCAVMVGENIQGEIEAREHEADATDGRDEDIATEVMDELYNAVPPHYRSFSVVSHALTFVLDTCPHHPTLLTALLDVCLSLHLVPESQRTLRLLFLSAITPSVTQSITCPLSHPAHSNYLTSLRATCCTPNARRGQHCLDDFTFTQLLVEALSMSGLGRVDAWTSKAVARLARELRAHNLSAFLHLCAGVAHSIADGEKIKARSKRKGSSPIEPIFEHRLRTRLARWIKALLDRIYARSADPSVPDNGELGTGDHHSVVNFLLYAASFDLHNLPSTPAESSPAVSDTLVCLATYAIANPPPTAPSADLHALADFLRTDKPKPETYDILVSALLSPPAETSPLSSVVPTPSSTPPPLFPTPPSSQQLAPQHTVMQTLRTYADTLRMRRLSLHEASLWSTALRHVEDTLLRARALPLLTEREDTASTSPESEMDALRAQLVARVESAEARYFGAQNQMQNVNPQAVRQSGNGAPGSEFVWEEMVGCWVQRSPQILKRGAGRAAKRRKLEHHSNVGEDEVQERVLRSQSRARPSQRNLTGRSSLPGFSTRPPTVARGRPSMPQVNLEADPGSDDLDTIPRSRPFFQRRPRVASLALVAKGDTGDIHVTAPRSQLAGRTRLASPPLSEEEDERSDMTSTPRPRSKGKQRAISPSLVPAEEDGGDAPSGALQDADRATLPTRRVTNFGTIVADALMNCIVLHPERKRKPQAPQRKSEVLMYRHESPISPPRPRPSLPSSLGARVVKPKSRVSQLKAPGKRPARRTMSDVRGYARLTPPPDDPLDDAHGGICDPDQLSSDDALNLFAYQE